MKRRTFIQYSSIAAGSLLAPSLLGCSTGKTAPSVGLQLYTLRYKIWNKWKDNKGLAFHDKKEIRKVLESVAKTGFDKVEIFDYKNGSVFGIPYREFNTIVNDLGMKITSGHYKTGQANPEVRGTLVNDFDLAVEDASAIGQEFIVIPWMEPEERQSIDDYKRLCELMNNRQEICSQAGIRLSYHNHEFEFIEMDGQIPYDVMLKELEPSITMELDLYWIIFAGKDPFEYFKQYPGRFDQWHIKDMSKTDRKVQTDIGTGVIDFKSIFAKAELSGLKHFYLEQEDYAISEFESIKNGLAYINTLT